MFSPIPNWRQLPPFPYGVDTHVLYAYIFYTDITLCLYIENIAIFYIANKR